MKFLFTALSLLIGTLVFGQTYSATDSVIIMNTNSSGFGNNSRGFEFVPNADLNLTHLGHRLPDSAGVYTWTIWETNSQSIVHQQVSTLPADTGWLYEPISTPITLFSGTNYILELNQQGPSAGYYYQSGVNQVNFNLTYVQMVYCNSCGPNDFPTSSLQNYHYGTPDFLFNTCNGAVPVTISESACDSYVSPSGNYTWTTSGTYVDSIAGAGCDTVYTINLTIKNSTTATQNESAIDMYTWPVNGQTYTTSGTYVDTMMNAAGCDSIVTLNLTMNYTGIDEETMNAVSIYPNPASDHINISIPEELVGMDYTIYTSNGKLALEGTLKELEANINIEKLTDGLYVLHVNGINKKTFRIVKQ